MAVLLSPLEARPVPAWYRDAKLGILVHWGLYSVPAFAPRTGGDFAAFRRDLAAMKDTGGRIPHAEWYLNALRVPGSPTARYHAVRYGEGVSYFDFRTPFEAGAAGVDFAEWADLFAEAGARYVVMATKHLDGYPLWPTKVPNPRLPPDFRSGRDLVGGLTEAVRGRGLRMGLYYAGGVDWTFTARPIRTMTDLMEQQAPGGEYARYAAAQWRELIDTYRPSLLWNDMGWPAEDDPRALFAHYYATVPDGVVNDRWTRTTLPRSRLARALYLRAVGVGLRLLALGGGEPPRPKPSLPHDFATYDDAPPEVALPSAWELTRGLGTSLGYNAQESAADLLSGAGLVHLLVDVVSKGGNLLINVGPDGAGRIPEAQQRLLRALGSWLRTNGEAIFGARPWTRPATKTADGDPVRFTQKDGGVYVIVLAGPVGRVGDRLIIRDTTPPAGARIDLLGSASPVGWRQAGRDLEVRLPPRLLPTAAHVLRVGRDAHSRGVK